MDPELAQAIGAGQIVDTDALVIAALSVPGPILVAIDAAEGRIAWMQTMPARARHLVRVDDGNALIVESGGTTHAIDLVHEAPSAREVISLEDHVAHATRRIAGTQVESRARQAELAWLARVADAGAAEALVRALAQAPLHEATLLAVTLRDARDPAIRASVRALLERTRTEAPQSELLGPRVRLASAIRGPLDDDTLAAESDLLVRWIPYGRSAIDGHHETAGAIIEAMRATRDLLERASMTRAPLDRFRAVLDDGAPSCDPDVDDAARTALLRHAAELSGRAQWHVPGATCVAASSLGGPIEVVVTERAEAGCVVSATSPLTPRYRDAVVVQGAPARMGWITCQHAWSNLLLLQEIDGLWRVVTELTAIDY